MGRLAELSAQTSMVNSLQAALNRAEWRLDQRSVVSPDAGIVADLLAQRGETLAARASVVSLLPPKKIFVYFFIPEAQLARAHVGQKVAFERDNCPADLGGTISFIAVGQIYAPFTYSKSKRGKFVFLAEDEGRATRPRPAGDSDACRRPAILDHVIDVSGVAQERRQAKSSRRLESPGRGRRNLRVSRSKRTRQNDHDPHAVRSTEAGAGAGGNVSATTSSASRTRFAPGRLLDAALQFYEDLTVFENLDCRARPRQVVIPPGEQFVPDDLRSYSGSVPWSTTVNSPRGLAVFDPTPGAGTSLREFEHIHTGIAASHGVRDTHPGRIQSGSPRSRMCS